MPTKPRAEDARRALITGLAGPHQDLFAGSAVFHAAISTLADFLPLMVNGLVEHAENADAEYQARLVAIKKMPLDVLLVHDWPTEDSLQQQYENGPL